METEQITRIHDGLEDGRVTSEKLLTQTTSNDNLEPREVWGLLGTLESLNRTPCTLSECVDMGLFRSGKTLVQG